MREVLIFYNGAKAIFFNDSLNLREWTSNNNEVRMFVLLADESENENESSRAHMEHCK